MKFSKLFEHTSISKTSKIKKSVKYDDSIIRHVRTLIEKNTVGNVLPSVSGPDNSISLPKETGVLLDSDSEREDDYFLSDEAYERLKKSQGDKSNFSEDSADEILGDPVVKEDPEPSEDSERIYIVAREQGK